LKNELKVSPQNSNIGDICFGEVFVFCNDNGRNLFMKVFQIGSYVNQSGVAYAQLSNGALGTTMQSNQVEIVKGIFKGTLE
jgi:hypothetical protein